jgi:hypothetical protein
LDQWGLPTQMLSTTSSNNLKADATVTSVHVKLDS